jgi:ribonuclease HII
MKPSPRADDLLAFEREAYDRGCRAVAGLDEAGRGPLAGPVVAAAVVLPRGLALPGVNDSKKLTPARREACFDLILSSCSDHAIVAVEHDEIDRVNILQATFRAMVRAVGFLKKARPDFLLIDGPYSLPLPIAQKGIPKGDSLSLSIAAASILAKVHRDRIMDALHKRFPQYGFDRNRGYPTAEHLEALRRHGPCPFHRRTFRGVLPQ